MVTFHKKVNAVSFLTTAVGPHLTQFELIMMFLQKVKRGVTNQDQRTIILVYKKNCQNCFDPNNLSCSLLYTAITIELTELEARIACKRCGAIEHITRACPKRIEPQRKSHANLVSPTTQYQIKCFKCGGNYRLSSCIKTTAEEKNKSMLPIGIEFDIRKRHLQILQNPKISTCFLLAANFSRDSRAEKKYKKLGKNVISQNRL